MLAWFIFQLIHREVAWGIVVTLIYTWTNTEGRAHKLGRTVEVDECACELFLKQSNWCVYHFSICLALSDYSLIIVILALLFTANSQFFQDLIVASNLTLPMAFSRECNTYLWSISQPFSTSAQWGLVKERKSGVTGGRQGVKSSWAWRSHECYAACQPLISLLLLCTSLPHTLPTLPPTPRSFPVCLAG